MCTICIQIQILANDLDLARHMRDYATADDIRKTLREWKIVVMTERTGTIWRWEHAPTD